jgi:hypothetical protein
MNDALSFNTAKSTCDGSGCARSQLPPRRFLSVKEAAVYLGGLSTSMLNKLRIYGGGPEYIKLGRRVVYSTDALDAFAEARKQQHSRRALNARS